MMLNQKKLSKRQLEELRKKQDEEATAEIYDDFVKSFEGGSGKKQQWIRGEVVNKEKGFTFDNKNDDDELSGSGSASGFRTQKDTDKSFFPNKTWVRKEGNKEDSKTDYAEVKPQRPEKARISKPTSKLAELASTFQSTKQAKGNDDSTEERERPAVPGKKKTDSRKPTNLEMFKEELRQMQEQRQERHKLKRAMRENQNNQDWREQVPGYLQDVDTYAHSQPQNDPVSKFDPHEIDDTNTTNLYVGNINPRMTEQQLCEIFGKFGPLASVKIMWPRTDEERQRGRNCGFVGYMNRRDADRAMDTLKGTEIMEFEMKLGWGKAIPIPPHPVYIPPSLAELTMPPPPSGLPFNSQPKKKKDRLRDKRWTEEELDKTLPSAVVKVVIPTDRNLVCTIHRMIEFVIKEGPMFEAMIMNRELNNPVFAFLFENQSPAHVYYRWKLFSMIQGDSPYSWNMNEFRMFAGGSIWRPPLMNPFTKGMPDELVKKEEERLAAKHTSLNILKEKKGQLTEGQKGRLSEMLIELAPERVQVSDLMIWCLDHADAAEEIVGCIAEAMFMKDTVIPRRAARLFLVSDILYNSGAKVPNASFYRKYFQVHLVEIFRGLREAYEEIDGRLKAEQFRQKVMNCFKAWEDWAIYPNDFLIKLQNIFLGLVPIKLPVIIKPEEEEDLDGMPIDTLGVDIIEDIDGKPILSDVDAEQISDIDGLPLAAKEDDLDGQPMEEEIIKPAPLPEAKFFKSKWEEVDETELEAQAMTTSKWDLLDKEEEEDGKEEDMADVDGEPLEDEETSRISDSDGDACNDSVGNDSYLRQHMSEERRIKLREIEVKVMKYQDEVEVGKRSRKSGFSLTEQVQYYRKKLLHKESVDSPARSPRKRHRSRSFSPISIVPYRSRSNSPKRSKKSRRSRSRSPRRRPSSRRRSDSRSPSRRRHKSKKKHRD